MKKFIAVLITFLSVTLLTGCHSKTAAPGQAFLKLLNVPDIRVKSIDLKAVGQRDYTKNYYNSGLNVSPDNWKNQFMRAIAEYTDVTISDEAAEAYIAAMEEWRDTLETKAFGNMFYRFSDRAQLGFSNVEKGDDAYSYWLNASKIMIKRVLGIDAVAKAKNITVSDDSFADYCKAYSVNTEDEKETAFARYCCLEDMVVRAYLPEKNLPEELSGILPEAFDTGFIDLSGY